MPSKEQHGSLSTRQQLLNSQSSLENARKRAAQQRKATSEIQGESNAIAVDPQRLRHLYMVFQPLDYIPSAPVFKKHLSQFYMEDSHERQPTGIYRACEDVREHDDLEEQNLMTKGRNRAPSLLAAGSGSSMSNEQRALLHAVFKKSVSKVPQGRPCVELTLRLFARVLKGLACRRRRKVGAWH